MDLVILIFHCCLSDFSWFNLSLWIWSGDLLMVAKLNFVSCVLFLEHFAVCLSHFMCPHTGTEHQPSPVGGWQPQKPTVSQPMRCMAVANGSTGQGCRIKPSSAEHATRFSLPMRSRCLNFWSLQKRTMPRTWLSGRRGNTNLSIVWASSLPEVRQGK